MHAEQRVESVERGTESGELRAKSAEYRAEVRRHRAKRGATEQNEAPQSGNREADPEDTIWLIVTQEVSSLVRRSMDGTVQ